MKKVISFILMLAMMLSLTSFAVAEMPADGVYEGKGSGFGGELKVSVTVAEGKIADIQVISHGETAGISDKALTETPAAIKAAQSGHVFSYGGFEVKSHGNPLAHAVLRGWVNSHGQTFPNYHYEDLSRLCDIYAESGLKDPGVVVDTNHSNSGKKWEAQIRISKEILHSTRHSQEIFSLLRA